MIVLINVSDFNPDDFTLTVRTRNGTELSIYRYMKPRSPSSRKAVSQIIIDSSYMPSSLVNEVIIRGESQRNILTLCEVSVYGRLNSFGWFRQNCPILTICYLSHSQLLSKEHLVNICSTWHKMLQKESVTNKFNYWMIDCILFYACSKIFHSEGYATVAFEGLQNSNVCLSLWAGGIFIIPHLFRYGFYCLGKTAPFRCRVRQARGTEPLILLGSPWNTVHFDSLHWQFNGDVSLWGKYSWTGFKLINRNSIIVF